LLSNAGRNRKASPASPTHPGTSRNPDPLQNSPTIPRHPRSLNPSGKNIEWIPVYLTRIYAGMCCRVLGYAFRQRKAVPGPVITAFADRYVGQDTGFVQQGRKITIRLRSCAQITHLYLINGQIIVLGINRSEACNIPSSLPYTDCFCKVEPSSAGAELLRWWSWKQLQWFDRIKVYGRWLRA
jgi:hypothetical protein